jgi:hypothetical protein
MVNGICAKEVNKCLISAGHIVAIEGARDKNWHVAHPD